MQKLIIIPALLISLLVTACQEKEIWIDVRTQEEFDSGHLAEAIHIPHEQIAERIAEVTENKDAAIHVYCRSGGRSGKAKVALDTLGFTNVINEGGYEDILKKRQAK